MSNPLTRFLGKVFPNRPKSPQEWVFPKPAASSATIRLKPGLYHFQRPRDGEYLRFHLRVDPDGSGLLLAAAAEAIRLSPAAAVVASLLLEDRTPEQAAETLAKDHRLRREEAETVVARVYEVLSELGRPDSRFPVFNLVDPAATGGDVDLMAPFQADLVLGPGDAEDADKIRRILDRLWEAAIPHVRFLVGRAEGPALVSSVTHAEDVGMITGVQATARALMQGELLQQLAGVGLDYVVFPWAVTPAVHNSVYGAEDWEHLPAAIAKVRQLEMAPVLVVPLVDPFADELEQQLEQLQDWKVSHLEVFAIVDAASDTGADPHAENPDADSPAAAVVEHSGEVGDDDPLRALRGRELRQLAAWIEDLAAENPLQITWLPPVAVDQNQSEVVADAMRVGARAGGDVSIRVAANGDVMPPRGPAEVAGNLLEKSWEAIWGQSAFDRFRRLVEGETRCDQCPGLAICAAACPADPAGWALPATTTAEKNSDATSEGGQRD